MTIKNTLSLTISIIVIIAILSITTYLIGHKVGKDNAAIEVTQQTILNKITDQYFIVTKTAYLQQDLRIVIEDNSDWSNLLWRDVIEVSGLVRVDIGVDLSGLTKDDISIKNNTVTITVPDATILNSSIEGDIKIDSQKGLIPTIEQLFEEEADDYNLTAEQLKSTAEESISQEMFDDARKDSVKIVELILGNIDYKVVIK
jgi:hypothetical protein